MTTKSTKPAQTQEERIVELHRMFLDLLFKLLKRGRPCFGPDGAPVVTADGKPVFKEIGAADLAVIVSYLRLINIRASLDAPRQQLSALIDRARQNGWKPSAEGENGAGDEPPEDTDATS